MADSGVVYVVVSNIPAKFRSADLRNYFSQFIESGGFVCFHYRHRPEVLKDPVVSGGNQEPERSDETPECPGSSDPGEGSSASAVSAKGVAATKGKTSCCCVVSVHAQEAAKFVKMYAGQQWIDSEGSWLGRLCVIRRIKVSAQSDRSEFPYRTRPELRRRVALSERFTEEDLRTLPEMNPPALMPRGNVGTPVPVFLQLIQACRLPPRLIRKLGLSFPRTASSRRYGNVPFEYRGTQAVAPPGESVYTAGGAELSGPGGRGSEESARESAVPGGGEGGLQSDSEDDADACEEWERHEALREDVTRQERAEERLFEDEIELKWEKGGSGLVFYTDAQYWKEEEGDFDEQTADDWDVDMSVYYDKDGGDKDARDYVRMRYERRLREGLEEGSTQCRPIGSFEKFTKGVGRRVMERQGWRDGEGLGHSQPGMAEALESEGQHPRCKRGFGYHGEKISTFPPVKKPRPTFLISTVYDQPKDMDCGDSLLRRQPTTSLKYRQWQPGGSSETHR
ncbi:G patch domain-containing protein 3 [Lepisosteus oculatus]|uniref:G patch domain-containing protein 3 n=1 Tax=Lepisosteus oculatus TaxID=7918 RepID=UPI0035F5152D